MFIGDKVCKVDSRMGLPSSDFLEKSHKRALEDGAIQKYAKEMSDGKTGVVGLMEFDKDGPTIAMRFDIDALPMTETSSESHLPYREGLNSQYNNSMHSCGHDGHAAIGIGVAKQVSNLRII